VRDNVFGIAVRAPQGVAPGVRGVTWRDKTGDSPALAAQQLAQARGRR
jgi:hypothetical protein